MRPVASREPTEARGSEPVDVQQVDNQTRPTQPSAIDKSTKEQTSGVDLTSSPMLKQNLVEQNKDLQMRVKALSEELEVSVGCESKLHLQVRQLTTEKDELMKRCADYLRCNEEQQGNFIAL